MLLPIHPPLPSPTPEFPSSKQSFLFFKEENVCWFLEGGRQILDEALCKFWGHKCPQSNAFSNCSTRQPRNHPHLSSEGKSTDVYKELLLPPWGRAG